ncbi:MlaC/ttg2D family ABC transporter substrate-binding protein [Paludibacterium purpuratum]|uniref:Phospholipid transport system substrate-binding protein n=1 Tax=Paludibacterium purpuratum TaxID=1144873 RepID=A0A4R7AW83_9NEIS|nr:ABC transporter substrate-binding protein [Paludibacterium purpuratum]TDR70545.1 phospholipid transport system substrate-binding protein [Paludibacterium purpuratum]
MKKLLFTLLSLLILATPVLARADASPVDFVRENSKQVLDVLKTENGRNTRKIRDQIETMVIPKFDFKRMTAFAVGKNWRVATPGQQDELTNQFQTLLIRVYASTMTRYRNAQIDVKPNAVLNNNGAEATVRTEVTLPNSGNSQKPISVDYTLYKTSQGWRVYNVSVEGASLVTAYRSQFDTEVRTNGVDGLIKSLKDKNAKLASQGSGA